VNIYIVAATELELNPLKTNLQAKAANPNLFPLVFNNCSIHFFVHGVGGLRTSYALSTINDADLMIQIGIAGSYHDDLPLGSCVEVINDQMGDEGAEDGERLLDMDDLGFASKDEKYFTNGILCNINLNETVLQKASSITVNMVGGTQRTIDLRKAKYNPMLETMEGAYFFYHALNRGIDFLQLRGISNFVTVRDKSTWKIKEAIKNVNEAALKFLTPYL
jgi:futalosine hydrolase